MKIAYIISLIFTFLIAGLAQAEGLADRKNEGTHPWINDHNIIQKIHEMHGPTAAGPMSTKKKHDQSMEHTMPTFMGGRDSHEYKHLNAHQYKRKVFGSNN